MKQKIYISGPITGLLPEEYLPKFSKADNLLKDLGFDTVNPTCDVDHSQAKTWDDYLFNDIKHLFACDGIYMLKGWRDSRGARIEHAIACEMKFKIMYEGELLIK